MEYQVVISINVHENFPFLLKQLEHIRTNVSLNYCVILNCNRYMYYECLNKLPESVYINPTIIAKRVHHGSLAQGIYSNMCYALQHFKFDYFLVCSSRNMFENNLTIDKINRLEYIPRAPVDLSRYNYWWWPRMSQSLLFQFMYSRNENLYNTAHEGLMFKYSDTVNIKHFLENHPDICEDTFHYNGCMEEFALQTIAYYTGGGCYEIGNGCCTEHSNGPSDTKFCYKVKRE